MNSVCFVKHILECGVIVLHVLEEPLLRELWVGQGLGVGLDLSLLEVVGVGLTTCEEVGVVKRVHLFSSEVRRVATALKVKDEREDEEVDGNGGLKVEETRSSCDDHEMTRTSET